MDKYQERYLKHQENKKNTIVNNIGEKYKPHKNFYDFWKIIISRRSQRIFNDKEISLEDKEILIQSIVEAPSSCNRQAIEPLETIDLDNLDRLLVGGKNWIKNAKYAILLFANMEAYKSPNEIEFMPYLDAGFAGQNLYLTAEALNIGVCYINPNIREEDKEEFNRLFNLDNKKFCGTMVFGYYDKKAIRPNKERFI